jgi:hypothetical protein
MSFLVWGQLKEFKRKLKTTTNKSEMSQLPARNFSSNTKQLFRVAQKQIK